MVGDDLFQVLYLDFGSLIGLLSFESLMGLQMRMYRSHHLLMSMVSEAPPVEYTLVAYMVEMVVDLIVLGMKTVGERRKPSSLVLRGSLVGRVDGTLGMQLVLVYLTDLMIACLYKFREEEALVSLPREILPPWPNWRGLL
jgi:hypothetical protein